MLDSFSSHDSVTIRVRGEVDCSNVASLGAAVEDAVRDGALRVTVDLDEVDFISASVLGELLGSRSYCRRRGVGFRVLCTRPRLRRLFTATNLEEALLRVAVGVPAQRSPSLQS